MLSGSWSSVVSAMAWFLSHKHWLENNVEGVIQCYTKYFSSHRRLSAKRNPRCVHSSWSSRCIEPLRHGSSSLAHCSTRETLKIAPYECGHAWSHITTNWLFILWVVTITIENGYEFTKIVIFNYVGTRHICRKVCLLQAQAALL